MIETSIPTVFWYHACSYAAFLINRMPCKGLDNKSPYQILFGDNVAIHNLKVFGTAIYPYLKPYNQNKLQARSSQFAFLRFAMGYKGVICYDIHSRKFIISRHVIHDGDVYPFKLASGTKGVNSGISQKSYQKYIAIQMPIPVSNFHNVQHHDYGVQEEENSMSCATGNTKIQSSTPSLYVPVMNNDNESQSRD